MKRIVSGVLCVLFLLGLATSPATAAQAVSTRERNTLNINYASPDTDGVLSEDEWDPACSVVLNKDSAAAWLGEVTGDVTYYFAWDSEGLYMAADVIDNDLLVPSDISQVYILDAVQFAMDPAGLIASDGGSGGMFYSIAMLSDGNLGALYHPYGGGGKIFVYEGAASKTDKGFSFEIFIPWKESIEILSKDGYSWTHGEGETINFILAMLDRDKNGTVSNCYTNAVASDGTVDFSPANYSWTMTLCKDDEDITLPEGIISTSPVTVNTYDPSSAKTPIQVGSAQNVGYRFYANAPFDSISVCCPSWGNNIGTLRLSLYKWNNNLSDTISSAALATVKYTNFTDYATLSLTTEIQQAGEYILLLHDSKEVVGVWNFLSDVSGGIVYANGEEVEGEFQASIHYTMTPQVNFGVCEDIIVPPSDNEEPDEPEVPEIPEEPVVPEEPDEPDNIISAEPVTADMFDLSYAKEALCIGNGQSAGYRFHANAPFDSIGVSCPSWSNNIGNLRFSLYKWYETFDQTVSGNVIASDYFVNFKDNAELTFEFDEQRSGEYLLLLHDSVETVGVWNYFSNASGGLVYKNGLETNGEFQARIHFTATPEVYFTECECVVKPPEEIVYSDEHAINTRDALPDTWDATDGLGRELPDNSETGDVREDKYVGLFYWTWHGDYAEKYKPYNITQITSQYPSAVNNINHSAWGPIGSVHYWNEPLFGYYSTLDEWVLRKHAEMLADAGVDVIIFDNTNGTFTWRESYTKLLEVFAEARADGVNTPKIAFMLPFIATEWTTIQLEALYEDIYRQGKYQDLWFYWEGKPLIMAYPDVLRTSEPLHHEIREFFTFRAGQASYVEGQTRQDQWGWLSVYPQQVYYNEDGTAEQITVGVAQNHSAEKGLTAMNGENVFGRTYTSEGYDTRENAVLYGANFAEQFDYALEVDPDFIFITGWNEWVAGRHSEWLGTTNAFPDQYNDTYSRDIEPSSGILKDHYYYQMVSYIRKFKGTNAVAEASGETTIDISSSADQWSDVAPNYYTYKDNTKARNSAGYLTTYYVNNTGRNDLSLAKVARDDDNVYFYVECENDITLPYEILSDKEILADTYNASGNKEPVPILSGQSVGYQFYATAPFDSMSICCPSWSNNIGNIRFSLYRWEGSYEKTIAGEALGTTKHINFNDNAVLQFNFSEQEAGEYLVLLHDTSEIVGVWNYLTNVSGGIVYKNGVQSSGELQATIHYTQTPETLFGDCSDGNVLSNNPLWMRLLIDVDDSENNWEDYEYILNRETPGVLERSLGGWNWEVVGTVKWTVQDNVMQVEIPRRLLSLNEDDFTIRFKWADNNLEENADHTVDILEFYQYGDVAPSGRFRFRFTTND